MRPTHSETPPGDAHVEVKFSTFLLTVKVKKGKDEMSALKDQVDLVPVTETPYIRIWSILKAFPMASLGGGRGRTVPGDTLQGG